MLKYELYFGGGELRHQQDFLYKNIYPVLGFGKNSGLTIRQLISLKEHLKNLSAECKIVGIEEYYNDELVAVHNWESFGVEYQHDWVEQIELKNKNSRLSIFVRLPEKLWKY
jgi:hypothetical protein